jgi:glycine/D-amino acid oxidase-like deaminating enzyme
MARRSVQTLVSRLVAEGVPYEQRAVGPTESKAGITVFACGPWLPQIFPSLLGRRIIPSRQEVLFFGTPAGDDSFGPSRTPCWMDVSSGFYGLPDLEHRGFKIANDARGMTVDPETQERTVTPEIVETGRRYLRHRAPELGDAPLLEARVCQYENTANGDYLIDHHPDNSNVWLVGGGSGHGFKHGPVVGEYVCDLILNRREPDPRFSLAAKAEFADANSQSTFYR